MKSIIFFSPSPLNRNLISGINIRLNSLDKWFKKRGFNTIIVDTINYKVLNSADVYYIMISSKKDSISNKLIKVIPKSKILLIDLYTPLLLEKKASLTKFNIIKWINYQNKKGIIKFIIKRGDHFLIVNKRQKKYWLNTAKEIGAEILSSNVSTIPSGSPIIKVKLLPPQKRKVILWFGGLYPWLNPIPLIEAFEKIAYKYPEWKLRFIGPFQPGTGYHSSYSEIMKVAKERIPYDQLEIIPWKPIETLSKVLYDVSFAVHLPRKSEEDYLSHRVRILTLLNAKIPVISSGEDMISEILIRQKAGIRVSTNVRQLSIEIEKIINNKKIIYTWSKNASTVEKIFINAQFEFKPLLTFLKKNGIT